MARPKKQTIEYFPHYVNHHKTMFVLESKYGNDGYAFWFKVLELLGSTNGMYYDCNNIADWEFLLAKTHLNSETANNILDTLADLDAIDKELWEKQKIIWSQNLVDNVRDAFKKRISEMPQKPFIEEKTPDNVEFSERKPSLNGVSGDGNGESKVKESKVEESKVEESISEPETQVSVPEIPKINESAAASSEFAKVIEAFNQNIHPVTPVEAEKLQYWLKEKEMEAEVIIAAISEAVTYNKRSMGYINAILRDWQSQNIKTQQDIEAYFRDRADEKSKPEQQMARSKRLERPGGTFNNYDQRKYDIKQLEKKLLGRDEPEEDTGG